ncbi:MAG: hypothetical protein KGL39_06170 [Patescibacteria group bacterium]|nr:hypothetical protein [Patescibacteria group bacterium]
MKRGETGSYRCTAGYFVPATILDIRPNGTIDIECQVKPPLKLTKRPWWNGDKKDCPAQSCMAAAPE